MANGRGASRCRATTRSKNLTWPSTTSRNCWPGTGSAPNPMKYTGWPAASASPISLLALKPPMPGPCPARGSTTTTGRLRSSIATPGGGRMRDSAWLVGRASERPLMITSCSKRSTVAIGREVIWTSSLPRWRCKSRKSTPRCRASTAYAGNSAARAADGTVNTGMGSSSCSEGLLHPSCDGAVGGAACAGGAIAASTKACASFRMRCRCATSSKLSA